MLASTNTNTLCCSNAWQAVAKECSVLLKCYVPDFFSNFLYSCTLPRFCTSSEATVTSLDLLYQEA